MTKKPTIQPLFDYVLVRPDTQESKTASGIYIPETVKEKPQLGTVMAVGTGVANDDGRVNKMIVAVGDTVVYKKWGGNEIKVDSEEWLLIEQKDIMAKVK